MQIFSSNAANITIAQNMGGARNIALPAISNLETNKLEVKYDVANLAWEVWWDGISLDSGVLTNTAPNTSILVIGDISNQAGDAITYFDKIAFNDENRVPDNEDKMFLVFD